MFMIQCPAGHSFPVPAKAAGSITTCPTCGATQDVPKLGELRKLPRAEERGPAHAKQPLNMGAKVAFAVFLLLAISTGLTSAFAAFRWQNLPIPYTQEQHIAEETKTLEAFSAVEMVSAWEQVEAIGLGEQDPFPYKVIQDLRDHWKQVCLISLGITIAAVLVAFLIVGFARSAGRGADT